MKKVREGLYIGCLDDALKYLFGSESGITHVLSLASLNFLTDDKSLNAFSAFRMRASLRSSLMESVKNPNADAAASRPEPVTAEQAAANRAKLVRKTVPLIDTEAQNLLDYLEECLEFIDKGRSEGSVLVHCVAGISRSATVITAYLMRSERLILKEALASLKECSKTACPNKGFKRQLQMFEEMGCVVDKNNSIYKKFHLENLGNMYGKGQKIELLQFAVDPSSHAENQNPSGGKSGTFFRCKKCRRLLALQGNVLAHAPGAQEKPYKWKKGDEDETSTSQVRDSCAALFVEPMQWMTTVQQGEMEGKLSCANCHSKVGSFNWVGVQCSCGTWINPAFQLHTSKVDASWT
ncbi:dual specificity protein phosphatase 12 isoform X2 [Selaginella moellendorffii]|uniref:dual specificity protein phosphatase 12 isoform X2 n=1 Tax=Selaginella moellendorffii TaxID=88036 RepID=UPI000D1C6702|nr:dual specificity protein phosphatase 12 isoform X2 [Selaginella moellendorffii]XP_024545134.1 dual specificity protein phosphatase 12 isoform X2 [Selaginella moellendorffii]|eukprot:XP_024545133.1 dual specificity protein phosphatase 12 isoform X2 [Selaginella moellendorffii]